jgi:predicted RNA-binding protein with PUA-like domain
LEARDQRLTYWLFKSEADVWSWNDQVSKGDVGEEWDGVRNYQARNNMRKMSVGDFAFFYHSQAEKSIVGIVEVCKTSHQDSSTDDPRWECVDIKAARPLTSPVSLAMCKADQRLVEMDLIKSPRLSVQSVSTEAWSIICELGKTVP